MHNATSRISFIGSVFIFIGIVFIVSSVSLFVNTYYYNVKELSLISVKDVANILVVVVATLVSFLLGVLGAYLKTKFERKKDYFEIKKFLEEAFLKRIEKSKLNSNG